MITALRPFRMRADGHINAAWMKPLGGENVVDVMALIWVVVVIKGVVWLLTMLTLALMVIKAMKSSLAKQRDEVAELVSPRWCVKNEVGIKIACPDHL